MYEKCYIYPDQKKCDIRRKTGVVKYREKDAKDSAQQALDDGHDALEMIIDGLAAGMKKNKEFG